MCPPGPLLHRVDGAPIEKAILRDGRLNALFVEIDHGNIHSAIDLGKESAGMA